MRYELPVDQEEDTSYSCCHSGLHQDMLAPVQSAMYTIVMLMSLPHLSAYFSSYLSTAAHLAGGGYQNKALLCPEGSILISTPQTQYLLLIGIIKEGRTVGQPIFLENWDKLHRELWAKK